MLLPILKRGWRLKIDDGKESADGKRFKEIGPKHINATVLSKSKWRFVNLDQ